MDKILNKKKIILIIGGGIAAYKSLDLIRLLKNYQIYLLLWIEQTKL